MGLVRLLRPISNPGANQRGFSLIELMVSVGISSAITLTTGGIIVNAVKTMQSANHASATSSLVKNIQNELGDASYASTPQKDGAGNVVTDPTTGAPLMVGCTNSFKFDMNNPAISNTPATVLADLKNGACVPVAIKMTRSGNTTISEEANVNQTAQGNNYVKFLEFCNASEIEADATQTTYTGELYVTQTSVNPNAISSMATSVMGPAYGAREYVSRVVVGVDSNASVTTCNAAAGSQLNGNNCTAAGLYLNPATQQCEAYVVQQNAPAISTCEPVTQVMYMDGKTKSCKNVYSACTDTTVAGGYTDGKLDCNRPNTVPVGQTTVSSTTQDPPAIPAYTDATSPNYGVTTPAGGITDSSGTPVANTGGATVLTPTQPTTPVAQQCTAALTNYISCLTALVMEKKAGAYIPNLPAIDCSYLKTAVCPNTATTTYSGTNNTTSIGTNTTLTQAIGSPTTPVPTGVSCTCGANVIANNAFCGYCSYNVDTGYGTYQNIQKVEQCQQGVLVPVPPTTATIINANPTNCSNVVRDRLPLVPAGGKFYKIP